MVKHPGKILSNNFMRPLGLNANQVARGLDVHRSTVGRLLAGAQRMTPEIASRLGAYFRVPARWWLEMQLEHDAYRLRQQPEITEGVTPLEVDPAVLLTPTGVLHLGEPAAIGPTEPLSIPRAELEQLTPSSVPHKRAARVVSYDSGSVALIGEGS